MQITFLERGESRDKSTLNSILNGIAVVAGNYAVSDVNVVV